MISLYSLQPGDPVFYTNPDTGRRIVGHFVRWDRLTLSPTKNTLIVNKPNGQKTSIRRMDVNWDLTAFYQNGRVVKK